MFLLRPLKTLGEFILGLGFIVLGTFGFTAVMVVIAVIGEHLTK